MFVYTTQALQYVVYKIIYYYRTHLPLDGRIGRLFWSAGEAIFLRQNYSHSPVPVSVSALISLSKCKHKTVVIKQILYLAQLSSLNGKCCFCIADHTLMPNNSEPIKSRSQIKQKTRMSSVPFYLMWVVLRVFSAQFMMSTESSFRTK